MHTPRKPLPQTRAPVHRLTGSNTIRGKRTTNIAGRMTTLNSTLHTQTTRKPLPNPRAPVHRKTGFYTIREQREGRAVRRLKAGKMLAQRRNRRDCSARPGKEPLGRQRRIIQARPPRRRWAKAEETRDG